MTSFAMFTTFAVALLVAATALCGLAAPSEAALLRPAPFGVASVTTMMAAPPEAYAREAQAAKDAGAAWIRIVVPWNILEPTADDLRWETFDDAIDAANASGLHALVLITGPAPLWAAAPSDQWARWSPPADPEVFGGIARLVADRYKSSVSSWEIWNEPNIPDFCHPCDAGLYSRMLESAYANIHSIQPEATVMTGGLSPAFGGVDPVDYVRQLYALGAGDSFDAVAVHPYTFPLRFDARPQGSSSVDDMRDLLVEHGQGAKRIWITEYGQATGTSELAVTEDQQSEMLLDFLRQTNRSSFMGPSFLFTTADLGDDPTALNYNFGLYRSDYTPKPVVAALRERSAVGFGG